MLFHAAHAYQPDGTILENAVLDVESSSGRIRELRTPNPTESLIDAIDLGDAMIMPGLINAHCHLEYSAFKGKLRGDIPFTDWIRDIICLKTEISREELLAALPSAISELSASGVTTLVDNLSLDLTAMALRESPLRGQLFFECIDFMPENAEQALTDMLKRIDKVEERIPGRIGFAPHGPHSVSPPLLRSIIKEAKDGNHAISIHASETPEEVEFFLRGSGMLAEMKREFGTLPASWTCPQVSPIHHLTDCGALSERTLLIHAACPQPGDIELIARNGATVVYCPGAHCFFQREAYPLETYLNAGINVSIGTDSLASNESLDLLSELRLVRQAYPEVTTSSLIDMVTRNPARALGLNDRGTLEPGRLADLSIWNWPYGNLDEWLEDEQSHCREVYLGGIKVR